MEHHVQNWYVCGLERDRKRETERERVRVREREWGGSKLMGSLGTCNPPPQIITCWVAHIEVGLFVSFKFVFFLEYSLYEFSLPGEATLRMALGCLGNNPHPLVHKQTNTQGQYRHWRPFFIHQMSNESNSIFNFGEFVFYLRMLVVNVGEGNPPGKSTISQNYTCMEVPAILNSTTRTKHRSIYGNPLSNGLQW